MTEEFRPFDDGASSVGIGDLTIEDAGESVAIYGTLTIEATRPGLEAAKRLAAIADAMVARLGAMRLPDALPPRDVTTRPNPFER